MGHCHLYRGRQIDDCLMFRVRLPYIQNRIADLKRIIHLRLGKALGTVLKGKITLCFLRHFFQQGCAVHSKPFDCFLILLKHLLTLLHGSGIIQMHNSMGRSLYRIEGFFDNMFSGLSQNLNGYILGYHVPFNKSTDKIILRVRGSGKAHLYLLKANFHQQFKKFQLILQTHGVYQRLISVPQIYTAPDGCLLDAILFHPVIGNLRRHMICFSVFFFNHFVIHFYSSLSLPACLLAPEHPVQVRFSFLCCLIA